MDEWERFWDSFNTSTWWRGGSWSANSNATTAPTTAMRPDVVQQALGFVPTRAAAECDSSNTCWMTTSFAADSLQVGLMILIVASFLSFMAWLCRDKYRKPAPPPDPEAAPPTYEKVTEDEKKKLEDVSELPSYWQVCRV